MKISYPLLTLMIGAIFSISTPVISQDDATESTDMPMMRQGGNMMMNPQMMAPEHYQMMSQMPHMMYGGGYGMPMMAPQMMQQMPHMGYGRGPGHFMPMMGQGMGQMMMSPEMMQTRIQHMEKMEQHLAKIESLLAQILEVQKSK